MDASQLLTVGQLARRAGLTAKALRHYDRVGVLRPAVVDAATGYRRYRPEQVRLAQLMGLLRSVDVPLEQVRACLADPDDEDGLREVLVEHRRRLQARCDRLRRDLHRIDHLIEDGVHPMTEQSTAAPVGDERKLAAELFNGVWRLLEKEDRTVEEDNAMLHMAHASRHHWGKVGTPANLGRRVAVLPRLRRARPGRARAAPRPTVPGNPPCRRNGNPTTTTARGLPNSEAVCCNWSAHWSMLRETQSVGDSLRMWSTRQRA